MENQFKGKKVGIWGFGKTGQSILSFLSSLEPSCTVLEDKELNSFQEQLLKGHGAQLVAPELTPQFIELNDIIIASPGIDLSPYKEFESKFITEVDLFGQWVKKPIIAITGSAGKTTVTTLITQLLNLMGKKAIAAGNIGKPMLDVLEDQDKYDYIILELSSFQLEYAKTFAPDISIILNIYPNHLDRHKDMQAYLEAKGRLLENQNDDQISFLPMDYIDDFWSLVGKQHVVWVGNDSHVDITKKLSDITCAANWQIILSFIEHIGFEPADVLKYKDQLLVPEHRLEHIGTFNGADFYNDSKATIPEATLLAISQFSDRPLILFLGGLSKGANRSELIKQLPYNVKHVICFGVEAEQLHAWCQDNVFESSAHTTLEDGFKMALKKLKPNDVVLFSPSGSSFDLFKNYEERGNVFKRLGKEIS